MFEKILKKIGFVPVSELQQAQAVAAYYQLISEEYRTLSEDIARKDPENWIVIDGKYVDLQSSIITKKVYVTNTAIDVNLSHCCFLYGKEAASRIDSLDGIILRPSVENFGKCQIRDNVIVCDGESK